MPVTVEEKFESRTSTTGPNASIDLVYTARGSNDDLEVKTAIDSTSPASYDGLPRQSISIEPVGDLLWEATVRYGLSSNSQPPPTGGSTFSFDTGGGTRHITQSLTTVGSYAPAGQTPPDFKGAIGVTSTGYANAIRLLESRKYPVERMHTHDFDLRDAELAIRTLARQVENDESIHSCLIPEQ